MSISLSKNRPISGPVFLKAVFPMLNNQQFHRSTGRKARRVYGRGTNRSATRKARRRRPWRLVYRSTTRSSAAATGHGSPDFHPCTVRSHRHRPMTRRPAGRRCVAHTFHRPTPRRDAPWGSSRRTTTRYDRRPVSRAGPGKSFGWTDINTD